MHGALAAFFPTRTLDLTVEPDLPIEYRRRQEMTGCESAVFELIVFNVIGTLYPMPMYNVTSLPNGHWDVASGPYTRLWTLHNSRSRVLYFLICQAFVLIMARGFQSLILLLLLLLPSPPSRSIVPASSPPSLVHRRAQTIAFR
ncbi:hypothetical protein F4778DRAFT_784786 [Xylariomycetidae sp. FL2044]|nr:hypothetical protein F4778DRAFT_784786 [Xylariomycetidae sp. FL2044]